MPSIFIAGKYPRTAKIVERSMILSSSDTFRIEESWLASPAGISKSFARHSLESGERNYRSRIG
jgi:hypothetical protein